jgi:peroxiredoxin
MAKNRWSIALVSLGLVVGLVGPAAGQTIDNARPVAVFRAYLVNGGDPTTVLLDGTPSADSDGTIVTHQWAFGDGTTGSGAQVEHTYPRIGEFDVSLVVIDNRGASHMTSRTIDLDGLLPRGETSREDAESRPQTPAPSSAPVGNEVGDRAPEFALPTLDGDVVKLSAYLGQVVVVNFWFGTCSACVAALPHLKELEAQYGTSGLVVIIVVLDRDPSGPNEFFSGSAYDGFVVVHEHDYARPTRTAYGVKGTPHAFLVDRSGVIRFSGKPNYLTAEYVAKWL